MRLPTEMTPDQLVAELLNHYRVFHKANSPEETMWSRSMAAVLGGYSESVLARACEQILRTRKNEKFPLPAEISAICAAIAEEDRRPALLIEEVEARRSNPQSKERQRYVCEQLLSGEMGKRAVREGWVAALFNYACEHNELPRDEKAIFRLKQQSEEIRTWHADCIRNLDTVPSGHAGLQQVIASAADNVARRERIIARVVSKEIPVNALWEHMDKWEAKPAA